jgi:hypothetical protein|tara:strand:- start:1611 stop:2150 length:540 start_codon:yes stop_codon:yes gene_type:complete
MSTLLSPAIDFKHLLSTSPVDLLSHVHQNRGFIWEEIDTFSKQISSMEGAAIHHTQEMEESFPLTHHLDNGLYTREVFMPKGSLVVSFIHKQNHPSFFMSGEMSILLDTGEVKRIKAPMKVMTEIGTQRVAYMHEDCTWTCVYRTDATTIEEAEAEVYTVDFRELPEHIILNKLLLCQD